MGVVFLFPPAPKRRQGWHFADANDVYISEGWAIVSSSPGPTCTYLLS